MRICLRDIVGPDWIAGSLYVENLAEAIHLAPESARRGIRVTLERHWASEDVPGSVDDLTSPTLAERAASTLAHRFKIPVPSRFQFPPRYQVIYPEFQGSSRARNWIGWIPDFQYRHLPQLFSEADLEQRHRADEHLAATAPKLIVSSEMARQDALRFLEIDEERLEVLPFASWSDRPTDDPGPTIARYDLPERFFLVCNQFWVHKDHETVLRALGYLSEGGSPPTIVCTGRTSDLRHPGVAERLQALAAELAVAPSFRVLGFIPRRDQLQLMRAAAAVLQPSLFEGWSTVIEDARSLGRPIIASDFPVHEEQAPDATFFRRGDARSLAEALSGSASLPPGPDRARERAAELDTKARMATFGEGFLRIARAVGGPDTG